MKSFHADSMAQDLKSTMRLTGDWEELRPDAREVLDRLQSAIGRIIAGEGGEKFRELLFEALEVNGGQTVKPDKKNILNNLLTKREKWLVVEGFVAGYIKAGGPMPKNGIGSLANEWLNECIVDTITVEMALADEPIADWRPTGA